MKEVTVSVVELLSKVKENREIHILAHKDAIEGYDEKVLAELQKAVKVAKAANTQVNLQSIAALSHSRPTSHIDDYDRAIKMLEMSQVTTVTLSQQEFDQLVLDQWNWRGQFESASNMYGKLGGAAIRAANARP